MLTAQAYNEGMKKKLSKELSAYFSELAAKAAKARAQKLTPEERRRIASNAAKARWAKRRKKEKP
jgi:hypothetical protein